MREPLFTGVCTALVTPFQDGNVNYPMLEQLLRRQMDAGIRSVVICGTTGEAPTLSDAEKLELFHRAKAYTGGDCLIIAGTGCNCTSRAAELSVAAQKQGADALLIVSPYYNKATSEGLIAHYMTIAHTVSIPIIAYNVPGRTAVDIPVSVCKGLAQIPNMVGIKEASGDISKVTRICRECPDFYVWTGNDDLIVPSISVGAKGVVSVVSNLLPAQTQAMANAALSGDLATAATMQQALQGLIELLFCEPNPIPVKAAMKFLGYDCGAPRLPLTELTDVNKKRLTAALNGL